ncbi:MAG TPA: serine hydrolase [Anaerovoracaceae bacterium]|nr:serine hydrolase [Anaerovoracaceae bacterium]
MLKEELVRYTELLGVESAFVIRDFNTGQTFAHNENLVVPSASLIKVPVMIEAFRQMRSGVLDPGLRLSVEPEQIVPFSVLAFLDSSNTYTLLDLIKLMIIYSDNTAANILIDLLGVGKINLCIRELGLKETKLQRKLMDADARKEGRENLTTAGEMAELMVRLDRGEIIDSNYSRQMMKIMKGQADECMMRVDLPDEITIARKSGELENLNHEMSIVYGNRQNYLYVFFVWDARSNNESRQILQRTSKMVFDHFDK